MLLAVRPFMMAGLTLRTTRPVAGDAEKHFDKK
jgi:hypothetical protein